MNITLAATGLMDSPLPLDTSGIAPTNLIKNENHTLLDARYRALVPKRGAFHTESVTIVDLASNKALTPGVDFGFVVPYSTLFSVYGIQAAGGIIIKNPEVSSSVSITYQAVGDDYVYNLPAIKEMLSTDSDIAVSKSFLDLQDRDVRIMPLPHFHDMGDGIGFEYLIFALEVVGRIFSVADNKVLASMFERIDIRLNEIARAAKERQDSKLNELMEDFRKKFTRTRLGLEKTPNMELASEEDGRLAGNKDYFFKNDDENKLISLSALIAFRESIMQYFVSKSSTGLGEMYGSFILPTITGMESMTNGARFIIDSLDVMRLTSAAHDISVYPDPTATTARWSLVKVSNNPNNRGGIFQATNMATGQLYMGVLAYNVVGPQVIWRKHLTEVDMKEVLSTVTKHIEDRNNPHKLTAMDVHLDKVENLPVATRLTILGRQPKREYVTMDGLLLFHSAFVTGDWTIDDSEDATPEQKAAARNAYTTLFAASGACGCDDKLTLEAAPRETQAPITPRGTPAGWYCQGTTKIAKFADGFGGYYYENIANDPECGYREAVAKYEIRTEADVVIGYGFAADGQIDPDATVELQDASGTIVCYIYPDPGIGHTTPVRSGDGTILGYAVNVI